VLKCEKKGGVPDDSAPKSERNNNKILIKLLDQSPKVLRVVCKGNLHETESRLGMATKKRGGQRRRGENVGRDFAKGLIHPMAGELDGCDLSAAISQKKKQKKIEITKTETRMNMPLATLAK